METEVLQDQPVVEGERVEAVDDGESPPIQEPEALEEPEETPAPIPLGLPPSTSTAYPEESGPAAGSEETPELSE